jgi:hypothetical protein
MKYASGGTRPLAAAVMVFGLALAEECAAQEVAAAPASFVVPTADKQCDEFNRSWVVANQHTYHSIKVQVRWSAVNARVVQEEFVLAPGTSRALGCASELEILSAEIMQF